MPQLHFNMALMQFLADHRTPLLTDFFRFFTDIGEINGYILIATLIYVAFDKTLAIRLSVLILLTMSLNHILKIAIKNPRPFVREGTFMQKWAVPPDYARDLAMEYSTPSGHAMACAAFYSYLYACVKNRAVRIAAVILIVLIGLSRPYLGVHYFEDILLGWAIGLAVALIAIFYGDGISASWSRLSLGQQIVILVAGSAALWLATLAINGWKIDAQPRAFVAYCGSLTGVLIARPLELRFVNFDPRSSNVIFKLLRYALTVAAVLVTLRLLSTLFSSVADNYSLPGYALQYVRYAAATFVNIFLAPLIFTNLRLAKRQAGKSMPPMIGSPG
jgi:membrane-associated phospholipid phosphatase